MTELWVQKDDYGNGRVLYVGEPDSEGYIDVGIAGVYEKTLTPVQARKMAKALKKAAKLAEAEAAKPKPKPEFVATTSSSAFAVVGKFFDPGPGDRG